MCSASSCATASLRTVATVSASGCPIRLFTTAAPALSDLEFASVIRQGSARAAIFYKNTLDVVPNVGGMFSEDQRCNYYLEAYNLTAGQDTGQFVVRTSVIDAVGKEIIATRPPAEACR